MVPSMSQSWGSKHKTDNLLADPCMSCLQYGIAIEAGLMPDEVLVILKYFFQLPCNSPTKWKLCN